MLKLKIPVTKKSILNTFAQNSAGMNWEDLKQHVQTITSDGQLQNEQKLYAVCQLLSDEVAHYDWVGFYFKNGSKNELKLGPYVGEPTDHTIIPFGRGICGQVAESNANFVVPDVQAQDNYIACSITVKAEIVVPLFLNGTNVGQIDIDSNTADPFTEADERFLEFVCTEIAQLIDWNEEQGLVL